MEADALAESGRMTPEQKAVLHWARGWWLGKRPRDWTERQHIAKPTVRVRNAIEKELAKAVANYVAALRRAE